MDTENSKGTIYVPTQVLNEISDALRPHWTPRTGLPLSVLVAQLAVLRVYGRVDAAMTHTVASVVGGRGLHRRDRGALRIGDAHDPRRDGCPAFESNYPRCIRHRSTGGTNMNMKHLRLVPGMGAALLLGCASAQRTNAPAGLDLSGTWVVNTDLGQSPALPSPPDGRAAGGRGMGGGRGAGGGGGRGGGMGGRGGGGGGGAPPNPEAFARVQAYMASTDRLVMVQGEESVALRLADGREINLATDKDEREVGEGHAIKAWWDEALMVEHDFGGLQVTERYTHAASSDRLIVTIKIDGRSGEFHRVYERVTRPVPNAA